MKWILMGILWIFIGLSSGNDSFVFPDETNISVDGEPMKLSRNEESNDFQKRNEFKSVNTGYDRPSSHGHHSHYEKDFRPHRGYNRPQHPSYYPGIVNQGYYHHRPTTNSQANAQANAQASNSYVNSNSQANSQSSNYGSPYYPSNGASSASSSASATTGIVNGRPVAAASAASAAAGAGGSTSSSSGATASGGYEDNSMSPWYYRNRIASDEMKNEKDNNEDDKITFLK